MLQANINVDYVNHMGTDLTVVNAARVSFDKESQFEYGSYADWKRDENTENAWDYNEGDEPTGNFRRLSEKDRKLINYLAKNNHWSPFGHSQLQVRVKAPIFLARQLVKHQVGLVWNEVSRRYVDSEPEFYFPDKWRGKPINAKQGSNDEVEIKNILVDMPGTNGDYVQGVDIDKLVTESVKNALKLYTDMLTSGVAPELARIVLPQNMMTEWYWTGSLYAWARVYGLRSKPTAQLEAREFAELLGVIVGRYFPVSWKALTTTH